MLPPRQTKGEHDMKVIRLGDCIEDALHACMHSGIIIEATKEEMASIKDDILYNEVEVGRVKSGDSEVANA